MSFKNHQKVNECLLLTRSDTATLNNGSLFWQKVEVPRHRGLRVTGGGAGTHSASLRLSTDLGPGLIFQVRKINKEKEAFTDQHLCSQMRPPTRQRGQINTSNTAQSCLQRPTGTDQHLQTLFKNKALF